MAIAGIEDFDGSVSGGCIENEVIVQALEVIDEGRPKRLRFGVDDETAWGAGLPCGGEIEVFIEVFMPDAPADLELIALMVAAIGERKRFTVASDIETGRREVVEDTGGDACGFEERGGATVFMRRMHPAPRILIAGAVHIAQVLVRLAAEAGYDCIVVDPREAYANQRRFPSCDVMVGWPDTVLADLGLDAASAVVALSHVPEIDDAALAAACASPSFYIGALGSRRNHARRCERLRAQGLDGAAVARISGPAGLDIGARGPAEIAVSILAEIVLAHRGAKRSAVREVACCPASAT